MDGGAWWAAVHGVAKSWTWLSDFTFTFHFHALEKEMATHSSVLAWRIPGTGEPRRLLSMGSHRVRHNWSNLVAAAAAAHHASLFLHYLLEFAQTHVHWVSDAIQQSHPLLPRSPLALNLSQHEDLFQRVGSLYPSGQSIGASTSVLPMSFQAWSPLGLTGVISLQSKGLSRVFSSTTVWRHQFFSSQPFLWSSPHIHTWLLEKP